MTHFHASFAHALLQPEGDLPAGLTSWNKSDTAHRFNVYRNNVVYSLTQVLGHRFPVVCELVGDAFFYAMAGVFVRAHPPSSPLLFLYGSEFAGFVEKFPPASGLPYLPDVCRLEFALHQAAHSADAMPLSAQTFSKCLSDASRLAHMRLRFHPSVSLVQSPYAIVSIWKAHVNSASAAQALENLNLVQAQAALVHLQSDVSALTLLTPGTAIFVDRCLANFTVMQAANDALAQDHTFDLTAALAGLLQNGALIQPDFGELLT